MWLPKINKKKRGVYRAIVLKMRQDIEQGILKPGDQLPPQRELAWQLQVNLTTVSRAYKEAMRQHLIGGEVGRGTFILANSAEASLFELRNQPNQAPNEDVEFVDLSTNLPALNHDDMGFKQDLQQIISQNSDTIFEEYHAPLLLDNLKISLTKWLAWRKMPTKPENIILAGGAQTALQAVLIALCKSGDNILVEQYTFPGLKDFARQFGLKLIPIKMDEKGILPQNLAEVANKNNAKFVILVPNHQNPTGSVMDAARQQDIAKVIAQTNLTLIEDDVYGGLSDTPPLCKLLGEKAIYISSLSKTVSFGLRIGLICTVGQYLHKLTHATNLTQWSLSPLMMALAIKWIGDGTAFKKAAWQLSEVQERRKLADNILPKQNILTLDKNCPHLWIDVSNVPNIMKHCELQNINVAAAPMFIPNPQPHKDLTQDIERIRISLVAPKTRQNLAIGLKKLAVILSLQGIQKYPN